MDGRVVKAPPFEFHRAGSADEAVAMLAELGDEAKVLAGGQSLVSLMNLRLAAPGHLVDINAASDLATVTDGEGLTLGSIVRHRTVERSDAVRRANPLLAAAVRFIGHAAIRTRGTIGGSVAHADPSAELPLVLVALDGAVDAHSVRGTRTIPANELFESFMMTSLEADELLTAVRIPALPPRSGWSFQEFSRRSGDFAVVGVAATLRLADDGDIAEARLAFSGVGPRPWRATAAEQALAGVTPSAEVWAGVAREAAAALAPPADLHGSAAYRKHLAAGLAERALREAHRRATEVVS